MILASFLKTVLLKPIVFHDLYDLPISMFCIFSILNMVFILLIARLNLVMFWGCSVFHLLGNDDVRPG